MKGYDLPRVFRGRSPDGQKAILIGSRSPQSDSVIPNISFHFFFVQFYHNGISKTSIFISIFYYPPSIIRKCRTFYWIESFRFPFRKYDHQFESRGISVRSHKWGLFLLIDHHIMTSESDFFSDYRVIEMRKSPIPVLRFLSPTTQTQIPPVFVTRNIDSIIDRASNRYPL